MVLKYVVKGLVGKYFFNFEECCEEYFMGWWFDWKKNDWMYMFFLFFCCWYIFLIGDVFGVVECIKIEEGYMRGDFVEL